MPQINVVDGYIVGYTTRCGFVSGIDVSTEFIQSLQEGKLGCYKYENGEAVLDQAKYDEKQNEAVFNIIHWQIIERTKFEDITKQMHLLSYTDRLAVIIIMSSRKIPQVYIEGCFHYVSDVKAMHSDMVIGSSYYEDFFAKNVNNNFNVPFKNGSYISRIKIKNEFSYIESNEPFNQHEIDLLNHIAKTFEDAYITHELKDWLKEQKHDDKQHNK